MRPQCPVLGDGCKKGARVLICICLAAWDTLSTENAGLEGYNFGNPLSATSAQRNAFNASHAGRLQENVGCVIVRPGPGSTEEVSSGRLCSNGCSVEASQYGSPCALHRGWHCSSKGQTPAIAAQRLAHLSACGPACPGQQAPAAAPTKPGIAVRIHASSPVSPCQSATCLSGEAGI